jgi:dipeptidyl aminopeptidase/acylaminoacyl peptidase
MRKGKRGVLFLLIILLVIPFQLKASEKEKTLRPIELEDILAWKSIRSVIISNDGKWFAYRLSPNEGDSEIVIRNIERKIEYRFPMGEAPRYGSRREILFSEDSKWLAFRIYPKSKEVKKAKKTKKKLYNKMGLVNLTTGKKLEFDKIKSFAFSGENSKWIAFHKYPPESKGKNKEKAKGSDLILHELTTGNEMNIGNISEFAFNKEGDWLAWIIDAQDQSGNGVLIRNMTTGVILSLDTDKAFYKRLTWIEKGNALAVLKGVKDENYEDKLYSVIGFKDFSNKFPTKIVYNPVKDKNFPEGMTISPNRNPVWTEDLNGILFGIHKVKKKEKTEKEKKKEEIEEEKPDLVIWHWLDKRLQSQQQVEEKRDKNFNYLCIYRIKEKKFIRLANEELKEVIPTPKHRWAIGFDKREYELMSTLDGRRYKDIYAIDLKTGERRLAVKKCRWYFGPSPDGKHFLYYHDGHFYTYEMSTGKKYNITKDVPRSFVNEEDDHNIVNPPIRPFGWVKDGKSVLLYDNWDVWKIPVHGGKGINLTVNGKKEGIRYIRRFRLDLKEKGIDLSGSVYWAVYGEWTKKGGIARIDKGKPGAKLLLWDNAVFSRLIKAKNADVFLYTKETFKDFPDYYVTDASLQNGKKITNANPQQKGFLWSSGAILLDYKSEKGDKLQAALFLPANYEKGKKYPTIVYIYEKLSRYLNRYFTPRANGFNKSVYTSRGYAVLMPDIIYKINDPGMSAVWCVLPAIKAAIATGIVDENKIGIHGHSWGGYQTAFLITQTDIFKAAVAGAPLTNLISMYSSIYWNTGFANQPIFESSQGRFTGGYWENFEAYVRNSPVFFAKNVKTPLLILHNDKDGAVDWNQGIEYFNTLRRLRKPVIMLQYKGENHSFRKPANQKDYTIRMLEFFDHYLLGKPAPKWLLEGIPYIKLKEHFKERIKKEQKKQ